MLLPGQIENWVVLTDLGKNGLKNLSISSLKQVLGILQANYRCRLGVNYIINPPKSVWVLWSCIKPFLDEVTIDKIKISKASYSTDLLSHTNPYQIEEKYGGKAPNLQNYWPPYVPDCHFTADGKPVHFTGKDSYLKYQPLIKEEQKEEFFQSTKLTMTKSIKVKVNSLDVSLEEPEMPIDNLENSEIHARSDCEESDDNLIDFEAASPFNRNNTRNPTFLMSGLKASKEFQRRLSIMPFDPKIPDKRSNDDDSGSEVNFDRASDQDLCIQPPEKTNSHSLIKQAEEGELLLENTNNRFSCSQCGIFKNACDIM